MESVALVQSNFRRTLAAELNLSLEIELISPTT
jgi:hypothetical protein